MGGWPDLLPGPASRYIQDYWGGIWDTTALVNVPGLANFKSISTYRP